MFLEIFFLFSLELFISKQRPKLEHNFLCHRVQLLSSGILNNIYNSFASGGIFQANERDDFSVLILLQLQILNLTYGLSSWLSDFC